MSAPSGLQFAGFDYAFALAQGCGVDEDDVLLFRSGNEEVARHREGILPLRNSAPHVPGRHSSEIATSGFLSTFQVSGNRVTRHVEWRDEDNVM
jgi:hypothetical protein